MDNSIFQKIRDEIERNDSIAIAIGQNPTIDSMAAALSLYLILKETGKQVAIACPTEPIVELSSLVGINKVVTALNNQEGDLVVSFPYVEGEIEKVSYTLDNGFLNIIVKSTGQGLTFNEKDVSYSKGGNSYKLLIIVGTPNISDLGDLIESGKLHEAKIINIDNNSGNQGYGDIVAVSAGYSSVSEQIADIALTLGIKLDQDTAQNLMDGIIFATNNFQEAFTSPYAFEIASFLMRSGAQRRLPRPTSTNHIAPIQSREPKSSVRPVIATPRQKPGQQIHEPSPSGTHNAPNDWLTPKVYKGSSNF